MPQLVAARRALVNFELIKPCVDPAPFLAEIARLDNPWDIATGRQDKIKVQREARAIAIRGLRKSAIGNRERRDVHESRYTSTARLFPYTTAFLESFAREYGGDLARAKIVCLPAGHRVYPHIDRGEYYALRDRFHLILQGQEGSWLKAGDEQLEMQTGELWRFDNKAVHEAYNGGDGDRIHFIFDLRPFQARDDKIPTRAE